MSTRTCERPSPASRWRPSVWVPRSTCRPWACAPATRPHATGALLRHPPDILITTPESLYLMLTSSARESLRTVEYVIVDEIHALAATKRGAHLSLTLERLDALRAEQAGVAAAAHRVVRDATSARRDRPLPRRLRAQRSAPRHHRRRRRAQTARRRSHRARRRHVVVGRVHRRAAEWARVGRPEPPIDLAGGASACSISSWRTGRRSSSSTPAVSPSVWRRASTSWRQNAPASPSTMAARRPRWSRRITVRCRASAASSSKTSSRPVGCAGWSRRVRSNSASTWARSIS